MKNTTLCYLEKDGKYLMLYRNKKKNDENEGKWIGVGGKFDEGETADECLLREVREETGVSLTSFHFYGIVHFISDIWGAEDMYLYSSNAWDGEIQENCNEGQLKWIKKEEVLSLPLWAGDILFLNKMLQGEQKIHMTLRYVGDDLVEKIDHLAYGK